MGNTSVSPHPLTFTKFHPHRKRENHENRHPASQFTEKNQPSPLHLHPKGDPRNRLQAAQFRHPGNRAGRIHLRANCISGLPTAGKRLSRFYRYRLFLRPRHDAGLQQLPRRDLRLHSHAPGCLPVRPHQRRQCCLTSSGFEFRLVRRTESAVYPKRPI